MGEEINNKEFIQFLYISLGSLAELDTQLIISKEIGYTELIFDEDIKKTSIFLKPSLFTSYPFTQYNV